MQQLVLREALLLLQQLLERSHSSVYRKVGNWQSQSAHVQLSQHQGLQLVDDCMRAQTVGHAWLMRSRVGTDGLAARGRTAMSSLLLGSSHRSGFTEACSWWMSMCSGMADSVWSPALRRGSHALAIQHAGKDGGTLTDALPVQLKVLLDQPAEGTAGMQ